MISLSSLVQEYARRKHPYSKGINKDEILDLIEGLSKRFQLLAKQIDFSPDSLALIENKMSTLHEQLQEGSIIYEQDEYILMVREISAYFIQVLIVNAGGVLSNNSPDLWNTQVTIPRPITAKKGRDKVTLPKLVITIGNSVTSAWDILEKGKKPTLYKDFKLAISSVIKEEL